MTTPNISEAARETATLEIRERKKLIPLPFGTHIQSLLDSTQAENVAKINKLMGDYAKASDEWLKERDTIWAELARLKKEDAEHCDRQDEEIVRLIKELAARRVRAESTKRGFILRGQTIDELNAKIAALESFQPTPSKRGEPHHKDNWQYPDAPDFGDSCNAAPTGPTPSDAATPETDALRHKIGAGPAVLFKHAKALERQRDAERAKSAALANSFGAELTAIQSALTKAGIAAAYSVADAVEELIASRDAERAARLKLIEKWESDTPGKPGRMLRALADTVARVCNSGGRSDPPSKHVEELGAERDRLRAELAKRPAYGALVAENKALRAELETVRKERDDMLEAIEAAGLALEAVLGNLATMAVYTGVVPGLAVSNVTNSATASG